MTAGRRSGNKPWKHIYGVDRKYTARVDRLRDRLVITGDPEAVAPVNVENIAVRRLGGLPT